MQLSSHATLQALSICPSTRALFSSISKRVPFSKFDFGLVFGSV